MTESKKSVVPQTTYNETDIEQYSSTTWRTGSNATVKKKLGKWVDQNLPLDAR
jgi:hypothetical protein